MSMLVSEILNQNVMLFYFINLGMENPFFNFLMPLITDFGSFIAWGIICVLLFIFGGEKGRKVSIIGLLALVLANIVVYELKYLVAEPRPFLVLSNVHQLISESEIYSFPSGHAASSFSVAAVIGLKYKFNIKGRDYSWLYPLIAFSILIGFSRIYIGVHYPLDVVFGAIVGIVSAAIALQLGDNNFVDRIAGLPLWDKLPIPKVGKQNK